MDNIPPCGTPWVYLVQNRESSSPGTLWVCSCSLWSCINLFAILLQTVSVPSFFSISGTCTLMMVLLQALRLQLIVLFLSFSRLVPLRINTTKCELFSRGNLDGFLANMKMSCESNFEILSAPTGDVIFYAKFIAQKRAKAVRSLSWLLGVGSLNPQIALLFLHHCTSFFKLLHLARSTPPSLVSEGLE